MQEPSSPHCARARRTRKGIRRNSTRAEKRRRPTIAWACLLLVESLAPPSILLLLWHRPPGAPPPAPGAHAHKKRRGRSYPGSKTRVKISLLLVFNPLLLSPHSRECPRTAPLTREFPPAPFRTVSGRASAAECSPPSPTIATV